jgi:hypothetical protein
MPDQLELNWLVQERPQPLPLDAATTTRLRAELLERRERDARGSALERGSVLRRRVWRGLAGGVTLAGTAAAVLAVIGVGGTGGAGLLASRPPATKTHHVIANASAQRLTHLSVKLADDPVATGNATLVLRRQTYPNSAEIDGADLYADNGDYYYSPSLSGLPAVIQQNETVNLGSADSEQRDIAAANAALTEPIDQARQQMSVASFDPNVKPKWISPAQAPDAAENVPAAVRQKLEQIQAQDKQDNLHSVISQEDGMIWDNGMDALTAGAGNPQVRAGVLKLFATIPEITSSTGTLNGQQTLDVTASLLSSNSGLYQEQIVLNAETGVPLEMIGGNQGQTPSVTVYYTITRTTVAGVENGSGG